MGETQQHTQFESGRVQRREVPPAEAHEQPHPLRRAPERLARVSAESEADRILLWARVQAEAARVIQRRAARSPVMPGGSLPVPPRLLRPIRPRPDL